MSKIKLVIELDEETYKNVKMFGTDAICPRDILALNKSLKNGTPIAEGDLISREGIRKALNEAFDCENATKYGNKNAEQQSKSYSTLMLYEIADIIEDCCDNAPSIGGNQNE